MKKLSQIVKEIKGEKHECHCGGSCCSTKKLNENEGQYVIMWRDYGDNETPSKQIFSSEKEAEKFAEEVIGDNDKELVNKLSQNLVNFINDAKGSTTTAFNNWFKDLKNNGFSDEEVINILDEVRPVYLKRRKIEFIQNRARLAILNILLNRFKTTDMKKLVEIAEEVINESPYQRRYWVVGWDNKNNRGFYSDDFLQNGGREGEEAAYAFKREQMEKWNINPCVVILGTNEDRDNTLKDIYKNKGVKYSE